LFRIIYDSKTIELLSGSASLAWTRLKARFEPQTGATLTQLKQEFTSSKLQKGESPDEWIEKLESIRNTIEQILGKQHIDNTDMMLHILNNLPEEYETIADQVTKELSNKTLTLESLQEDLQESLGMMATQKEEEEAAETEVSFVAMHESTKKSDLWIGDTGASTHMKNTLDGLFDLRNGETIVKIGNGTGLK
jgi:gag-polypeptide of LTR copia-type